MNKLITSWKFWLLASIMLFSCILTDMKSVGYYSNPTPTLMACGQTINSDLESQAVTLINEKRSARGLSPFIVNDLLTGGARRHSTDMACNNFLANTGSDGATWHELMVEGGYLVKYGGITTAGGYENDIAALVKVWSEQEYSFIYDTIPTEIGVGVVSRSGTEYRVYWTVLFALPNR